MPPVSSTTVHSRLETPPWGWTRSVWILPAMRTGWRNSTLAIGVRSVGQRRLAGIGDRGRRLRCRSCLPLPVRAPAESAAAVRRHRGDGTASCAAARGGTGRWSRCSAGSSASDCGDRVGRAVVQEAVPEAGVLAPRDQHARLRSRRRRAARRRARPRRGIRRSGHSTMSSGRREKPRSRHAAMRSSVRIGSRSKCTARSSSGVSVRAYWMARAAATSSWSTNTRTAWRRSTGASAACGGALLELLELGFVLLVEAHQQRRP